MTYAAAVLDQVVGKVLTAAVNGEEEARCEPIVNPGDGRPEGMVVQSPLERVAIFVKAQDALSLGDLSALRRSLARAQARRGYVYVLSQTAIQKPVMLLATLSNLRIVRVEPPAFA